MNDTSDTSSQGEIDNLPTNISSQLSILNNTFQIATNNVRGLSEPAKQRQLMNYIQENKIDIMGVSETKLNTRTAEFMYKHHDSYLSWWNCEDSNQAGSGVGLIINKNIAQYIQSVRGHKGRVIYADLFMKGRIKLRIIQLYINANMTQKVETLELYSYISKLIQQGIRDNFYPIVMGDFNANLIKLNEIINRGGSIP